MSDGNEIRELKQKLEQAERERDIATKAYQRELSEGYIYSKNVQQELSQLRAENEQLLLNWNGSLQDTYELTGKQCQNRTEQSAANNQLRADLKTCAETLLRTSVAIRSPALSLGDKRIIEVEIQKPLFLPSIQTALKEP